MSSRRTRRFAPRAAAGLAAVLVVLAAAAARAGAPRFDERAAFGKGHALAAHVIRNEPGPVWAELSRDMRVAMQDSANFAQVIRDVQRTTGALDSLLEEDATREKDAIVYRADCRFARVRVPWTISLSFDGRGRVVGFFVRPSTGAADVAYPSRMLDYVNRVALRLPFDGEWTVLEGGRDAAGNAHARLRDQRFAVDFAIVRDGKTHAGDGSRLADYYCYGAVVVAPAAGVVVAVRDSLPDNRVGRGDPARPLGNHVVLDLGQGEFAVLAHLQPRSIRVRPGDKVAAGRELGRCGNSGDTPEPRLHFHLQSDTRPAVTEGLPVRFRHLLVNGAPADTAEVVRGQRVAPGK